VLLFPLSPNSKIPPAGVSWKTTGSEDRAVQRKWRASGNNLGFPTGSVNGAVVIDFDDKALARLFYRGNRAELGTMVETRKGVHFYFRIGETVVRNSQKKDGFPYDVRGEGGYVVYPDSIVDGWTYKFVRGHGEIDLARLPLLKPELIPPPAPKAKAIDDEPMRRIYRARLWIQKVPGAVSGQGGHAATWRVACHLTGRFGLSVTEAMPLMLEWNDGCKPPWSFYELSRKLNQASQEPAK